MHKKLALCTQPSAPGYQVSAQAISSSVCWPPVVPTTLSFSLTVHIHVSLLHVTELASSLESLCSLVSQVPMDGGLPCCFCSVSFYYCCSSWRQTCQRQRSIRNCSHVAALLTQLTSTSSPLPGPLTLTWLLAALSSCSLQPPYTPIRIPHCNSLCRSIPPTIELVLYSSRDPPWIKSCTPVLFSSSSSLPQLATKTVGNRDLMAMGLAIQEWRRSWRGQRSHSLSGHITETYHIYSHPGGWTPANSIGPSSSGELMSWLKETDPLSCFSVLETEETQPKTIFLQPV